MRNPNRYSDLAFDLVSYVVLTLGLVAILYLLIRGLIQRRYKVFTAIPYGPFLILGGATMLYFGTEFMSWYF